MVVPCACELARYVVGSIPLDTVHMFWWRLSFSDQSLSALEVRITQEMKAIFKRFEDLDICGKVTLRSKLRELEYPDLTSMCAPLEKVKTKGGQKKRMTKQQRSMKPNPSYFEFVDALHSVQDNSSTLKRSGSSYEQTKLKRNMSMLDQFHPCIQDFIEDIVDVKADGNCRYRVITVILGLDEDSWSLVRNHLLKELVIRELKQKQTKVPCLVSNEHVIRELKLVSATKPSILGASLPNFLTFLP